MATFSATPVSIAAMPLSELFSGDRLLVIPDMQRDYCWDADRTAIFCSGILRLAATATPASLGLAYGYEMPQSGVAVHIIDGQQRLTTIFLLIGMLYRRTAMPALLGMLMAGSEPRLAYQGRNEAMYFLCDLTEKFFVQRQGRLSQLEQQPWFYASYASDPSVQHFIMALRAIDALLDEAEPKLDMHRTAAFAASSLRLTYCRIEPRQQAEQMFITINSTGMPLTYPQSLRAITLALSDEPEATAKRWNEMEDWAWRNSADLLAVVSLFATHKGGDLNDESEMMLMLDPVLSRSMMHEFYAFFSACRRLCQAAGTHRVLCPEQRHAMATSAAMHFALRFTKATDAELSAIWGTLYNITLYQRLNAEAMQKLCGMARSADPLSFVALGSDAMRLLPDEEQAKLSFIAEHADRRTLAETLMRRAESHGLLIGRVATVIAWTAGADDRLAAFERYVDAIYGLWGRNIDKQPGLDPLRRALLALRHPQYPIVRRGDNILSLCWHAYDWQRLMALGPGLVRLIADRCISFGGSPDAAIGQIISRFSDKSYPYYNIIKKPALIANCRKRQLLRPCLPFTGIYDTQKALTVWLIEQTELKQPAGWTPVRAYGAKCLYANCLSLNIAVDIYWQPEAKQPYRIEFFSRADANPSLPVPNMQAMAASMRSLFAFNATRGRYQATARDAQTALRIFSEVTALALRMHQPQRH